MANENLQYFFHAYHNDKEKGEEIFRNSSDFKNLQIDFENSVSKLSDYVQDNFDRQKKTKK